MKLGEVLRYEGTTVDGQRRLLQSFCADGVQKLGEVLSLALLLASVISVTVNCVYLSYLDDANLLDRYHSKVQAGPIHCDGLTHVLRCPNHVISRGTWLRIRPRDTSVCMFLTKDN